jgi:tetratricopeptide (TPR) repeat protein
MIVFAVILFVIIALLVSVLYSSAMKKNRLERALTLLKEGEYGRALKNFEEMAERNPTDVLYHYYMGICCENLEQFDRALVEFNKVALSTNFEPPIEESDVHFRIARLHLTLGNEKRADQELQIVIQLDPTKAEAYYHLGVIARDREELQRGLDYFNSAIIHDREFARAYLEMGKISFRLTHHEKARKALMNALSIQPELWEAHYYYGLLMERDRSFTKAIEEFLLGMKDARHAFSACSHLAAVHVELGEMEKAFEFYEKALKQSTTEEQDMLDLMYRYGNNLVETGELDRALSLWADIQKIQPGYKDVDNKLQMYGQISKSDSLTRLITASKRDFLETGRSLCGKLHVKVESYTFGKDNFIEFLGNIRMGVGERSCIVHLARWTVQVGEIPIRELLERMAEENAAKGYFITTSSYTDKAMNLANIRPIELIDRERLEQMLMQVYG